MYMFKSTCGEFVLTKAEAFSVSLVPTDFYQRYTCIEKDGEKQVSYKQNYYIVIETDLGERIVFSAVEPYASNISSEIGNALEKSGFPEKASDLVVIDLGNPGNLYGIYQECDGPIVQRSASGKVSDLPPLITSSFRKC